MLFPIPENELDRLATLHHYDILDTPPEDAFDRITRLAAQMFGVPVALVSLVDEDRQWFKSRFGLDVAEMPRDVAFCAHAIMKDQVMVVSDATRDPRFKDNPLVSGEPYIRFYAGVPLTAENGHRMGTLCLVDFEPRDFDQDACGLLADLGALVCDQLLLRNKARDLRVATDQANAASAEKSRFMSSMSHEMRTPMNSILGFTQLMSSDRTTRLTQKQEIYLDHIRENGQRLLGMIDDVLELERVTHGERCSPVVETDLVPIIGKCVTKARSWVGARPISIEWDPEGYGSLRCNAEEGCLYRIMINLLSNAVKFNSEPGQIRITLDEQPNGMVRVSVADTGSGVPEHARHSLFRPFERAGREAGDIIGAGVGLTIALRLVESMGGALDFSANDDVGSTFWVELPLVGYAH